MSRRFLIFFLTANLFFTASQLPMATFIRKTPPETFFPLYHTNSWYDYNMYLSAITQGASGAWRLTDPYTTEKTNPTFFYIFYILVGHAAAIFRLPNFLAYHAARVAAVELYFLSLYVLSRAVLGSKRALWGAILAIVGTIAPVPFFGEPEAFYSYTPWWAELEAFKRLDVMPHYLAGYTILFFIMANVIKNLRYLYLPLLAFFAAIIFPPSMLPIVVGIPIMLFLFPKKILPLLPIFVAASLGLFLIWRENGNGFPWDFWNVWERSTWNHIPNFTLSMALSMGILPVIALPSVVRAFREKSIPHLFLTIWAFLPALLLPFIDVLGFSKYRIMTVAPFVPFALLAAQTIYSVKGIASTVLLLAVLATVLPVSAGRLANNIHAAGVFPVYPIMYIPKDFMAAVQFLKKNAPVRSVILTDAATGSIIPAHAPVVTYIGHNVHTYRFFYKEPTVNAFLAQEMDDISAQSFVKANGISYVVMGFDRENRRLSYPFLKLLYEKGDYAVYAYKKH